ncbi:MAG TPA: dihydrofolate reductase family protein [Gemmatimonadaceae bacterium]
MIAKVQRPRVICHMTTSIDGRIVVDGWPPSVAATVRREYEEIHATFGAEGWICGRITMEPFAKRVRTDAQVEQQYDRNAPRADFRAGQFDSFAFAIDARGRLAWESNDIGGDHVVAILSERVSDEYLAFLREKNVSYLLAGESEIDLSLALDKIARLFGVRTLLLEGGGRINGTMLREGLIDEVSLIVAAVADGAAGKASLFDVDVPAGASAPQHNPAQLMLRSVEQRPDNIIWLRYDVVTGATR